jgi:hypothetical protein
MVVDLGSFLEEVVDHVLQVAPGAVLVREPELQGRVGIGGLQDPGEHTQRPLHIIRMDQVERNPRSSRDNPAGRLSSPFLRAASLMSRPGKVLYCPSLRQ